MDALVLSRKTDGQRKECSRRERILTVAAGVFLNEMRNLLALSRFVLHASEKMMMSRSYNHKEGQYA